jgi:serine protease Do
MHVLLNRSTLLLHGIACLVLASMTAVPAFAQGEAERLSESFRKASEKVLPAVVSIRSTEIVIPGAPLPIPTPPFLPRVIPGLPRQRLERLRARGGSGFVVDAERGLILTCEPVLSGSAQATVIAADGREIQAERVIRDPSTNLVLVTVDPRALRASAVAWGDSERLRIGDWVLSLGRPSASTTSVSAGIVGGRGSEQSEGNDQAIRTDCVIDAANTGGPLIDLDGNVVGVNLSLNQPGERPAGFGFAIPAAHARKVVEELAGFGQVRHGYLGVIVESRPLDPGNPQGPGTSLVVSSVAPGSPAAEAGLRVGDLIVAIDDRPIQEFETLSRTVEQAPIGQEFRLTIERAGKRQDVAVHSRARPETPGSGGPIPGPRAPGAGARLRPQARPGRSLPPRSSGTIESEPEDPAPGAKPGPATSTRPGRSGEPGAGESPSSAPDLDGATAPALEPLDPGSPRENPADKPSRT